MSDEPGEADDLGKISGPPVSPPTVPDPLTVKALEEAKKGAKKPPTPTEHFHAATNRHLTDACGQRENFRKINKPSRATWIELFPKVSGSGKRSEVLNSPTSWRPSSWLPAEFLLVPRPTAQNTRCKSFGVATRRSFAESLHFWHTRSSLLPGQETPTSDRHKCRKEAV